MQNRVRRLVNDPREDDRIEVERLRQLISMEMQVHQKLHLEVAGSVVLPHRQEVDPDPQNFDDLDDDPEAEALNSVSNDETMPMPEHRPVPFPSNCLVPNHPLRTVELEVRKHQARSNLNALREVISEKSFQYSHVLRKAPKKSVKTRARTVIARLNNKITLYSRAYARARAVLVRLGADEATLQNTEFC